MKKTQKQNKTTKLMPESYRNIMPENQSTQNNDIQKKFLENSNSKLSYKFYQRDAS